MTTIEDIRTVERLMLTLDDNPHLLEAVRARVLTREVRELPQIVANLSLRVEEIAGQLAQLTERVDRLTERVDQLTERVDQIAEQLAQLSARVDQLTALVEQMAVRMDRRFDQVAQDQSRIKDFNSINSTKDQAHVIACLLGLESRRYVEGNEIIHLVRGQDTSDTARGDLISFYRADLIIEAADGDGNLNYIAVEVSFTADGRDTRRAIRNAGYLTRFTGRPAYAVVTGWRLDWAIQPAIDAGEVMWYPLSEDEED